MSKKKKRDGFCIGTVTVIMANNFVLTGQLKMNKVEIDDEEFLTLTLTAPVLKIPGAVGPALEQPVYVVGDMILINEDEIVTVGPSHV
jgi:hypothetical protein